MPFLKSKCPSCSKTAEVQREFSIGDKIVYLLKCSHIMQKEQMEAKNPESIISLDGKKLYPFQAEGVRAVEKSGGRILIADEMGLGKTVQALSTLSLHPDMLPVLIICKSSLKIQWQHEWMRWIGENSFCQVLESSSDIMLPGLPGYIVSFDLIRRFNGKLNLMMKERGIKTVIIDECQQIKNPDAQRSMEVRDLCRGDGLAQDKPLNIIALSGTPIKNHAGEYFTILNILKPEIFPRYASFQWNWCDSYWNGYSYKSGGLKNPKAFTEKTKSFIIRRERKDVMPDLPSVSRQFQFCDLAKEVEKAYIETFKQFRDDYNGMGSSPSFSESGDILAYLSKMRHLTGLSKIAPAVDFVEDFLSSTDRRIAIFVHHKDVGEILGNRLTKTCEELGVEAPLRLTAELNSESRARIIEKFTNGHATVAPYRVLIASTLAAGEGLNLQACSDCLILERQWNPANEEQAECRFIRIGQTADKVTATYFVAVGTVDEFFSEIVERKREIVVQTLGGEGIKWDQSSLIKELATTLADSGGRKWSI